MMSTFQRRSHFVSPLFSCPTWKIFDWGGASVTVEAGYLNFNRKMQCTFQVVGGVSPILSVSCYGKFWCFAVDSWGSASAIGGGALAVIVIIYWNKKITDWMDSIHLVRNVSFVTDLGIKLTRSILSSRFYSSSKFSPLSPAMWANLCLIS